MEIENAAYSKDIDENETNEKVDDVEKQDDVTASVSGSVVEGRMARMQRSLGEFWEKNGNAIALSFYALLLAAFSGYLAYALYYEFGSESSIRLLWMSALCVFCAVIYLVKSESGDAVYDAVFAPIASFVNNHYTVCKWLFLVICILFYITYITYVAIQRPDNLVSFSGIIIFVLIVFLTATDPSQVKWRPVLWGLGLQFVFALLVLQTVWGYEALKWLGDRVQEFMNYANAGSAFVFGENYAEHMFAFQVLPTIVYFSSVISVLYYLGWIQVVIEKLAWIMVRTMRTTAGESTNAAGNIFLGQTEAPLLVRPMLPTMTKSEMHAVIVGGYATVAGTTMASYIAFGVPANHLITASIMAAPCALAFSKLAYPETEVTRETAGGHKMEKSPQRNVVEAACYGATTAIPLVANIAVNLIAFIALLEFLNTMLTWCGHRVGFYPPDKPEITFEFICSYLLWPFAFIMGCAVDDCRKVAELLGIKIFLNEFVAFTVLGEMIDNSEEFVAYQELYPNGTYSYRQDDLYLTETNTTLYGGVLTVKSSTIATYALCGFANISSIGTMMGGLGGLVPERQKDIAAMVSRAMLVGCIVSMFNGSTAGLLYDPTL